ncbi:MAG TPA: caspase family protein [Pyrinomonadaceae bacterium]|nr:caspase family protein [Pyrinomonadaceae bacterium]
MKRLGTRHFKLILVLATTGLLLGSWHRTARAQQDRQLLQTGSANQSAKRIALVIGNGAYTKAPPLKNPPNDGRDMAATLRTLGFDVTSGINVNQRDLKRLIREFGQKLKGGGSGLFYYAGHGVQSKGRNYLIPIDADIQSEAEVEDSGVDASLILNYMDDARNGLNIVILDACRNNPFARSFRSASDGLAQVDAPTGTLIAYATAPGHVASDGTDQNGLYTSELLKQMQTPGLSITDVFMRVRAEVMKQTGSKQVPWEASSLVGSFYFSGGPTNSTAPGTNEAKVEAGAFELSYWETIKNSTSADDFKAYLEHYPTGQFASLAKNRIRNLEIATKPAEIEPATRNTGGAEIAFWESVRNSTSPEDFRAYLKRYTNGEFAELAKSRLKPLEDALAEKEKQQQVKRAADAEYARTHKSFTGRMGTNEDTGKNYWPATLFVSPEKISLFAGIEWVHSCSSFKKARVEGDYIREISGGITLRFRAASPAEAASALEAIQTACKSK